MSSSVHYLSPAQLRADLGVRDLSDPAAGPHAIQLLTDRAVAALSGAWSCEVRWCRGPKIVPVADNYDRLGYPPGAITREETRSRYTRYLTTPRPEGRGFRGSRPGVPVSQPTAEGGSLAVLHQLHRPTRQDLPPGCSSRR